jgi:hypothetical protein
MAEQKKNMIKALNEQKYLRNLQNDFKPNMIFRNQSEKKPKYIEIPKSVESADSSAETINESIFSNDISPFSSYLPFSNDSGDLTIDDGSMTDHEGSDLDKLYESVENVKDIFVRYKEHINQKKNSLASSLAPALSRQSSNSIDLDLDLDLDHNDESMSLRKIDSLELESSIKIDSPRVESFINSINLLEKLDKKKINDKKNKIKKIFVKSPYTSGEDTDSAMSFSDDKHLKMDSASLTNSADSSISNSVNSNSANSVKEDEQIKIRERKNRVLIKINTINGKKSELIPLKISFFGGSTMNYEDCKKVIQEVKEGSKDQIINKETILAVQNESDTKTQEIQKLKDEEIQKLKDENKKLTELANVNSTNVNSTNITPANSTNITPASSTNIIPANDMGLTQLLNASLTGTPANVTSANDMGLAQLLNASLTGTQANSANDVELENPLPTSANDMGLTQSLNASLTEKPSNPTTVMASSNSANDMGLAQLLNTSLNEPEIVKSLPNGSQENNQKYVVEITFDNETLEPTDIIINRTEQFKSMTDNEKPSNYLFSVNQFIMEQIKTKNRGYILEGETTMACYFSDNGILDFDTPVLTF